jgi:hypothetical protein
LEAGTITRCYQRGSKKVVEEEEEPEERGDPHDDPDDDTPGPSALGLSNFDLWRSAAVFLQTYQLLLLCGRIDDSLAFTLASSISAHQ